MSYFKLNVRIQVLSAGAVFMCAAVAVLAASSPVHAQGSREQQLFEGAASGVMERLLLEQLQGLDVEHKDNWDNTIKIVTGYKTVFQGIKSHLEPIHKEVPHGLWKKSRVRMDNAANNLDVKLRKFRRSDKLEIEFQVYVSGRIRGELEARAYNNGAQLARGTFKGRARVEITIDCQAGLYKDGDRVVLRTKVKDADVRYSDVVLDRAGHFGGYSANVLGDAFTGAVDTWFSKKKQEALNQASSAIKKSLGYEKTIEEPMRGYLVALIKAMG